jgi:protein tyrosine phosphatase
MACSLSELTKRLESLQLEPLPLASPVRQAPSHSRPPSRQQMQRRDQDDEKIVEVAKSELIRPEIPFAESFDSTIEEAAPGIFLAVWVARVGFVSKKLELCGSFCANSVWEKPHVIVKASNQPYSSPVLLKMPSGELLLFFHEGQSCFLMRSKDGGKNWSEKEALKIFGPKKKPILLADSTIVCASVNEAAHPSECWIEKSFDGGKNWVKKVPLITSNGAFGIQDCSFFIDSAAVISLLFNVRVQHGRKNLYRATSVDGGDWWERGVKTDLETPYNTFASLGLPCGRVLAVCNPRNYGASCLSLMVSNDNGNKWKRIWNLEQGLLDCERYSNPSLILGSDGYVHITYSWQDTRIKHVVLKIKSLEAQNNNFAFLSATLTSKGIEKFLKSRKKFLKFWNGFHRDLHRFSTTDISNMTPIMQVQRPFTPEIAWGSDVNVKEHHGYFLCCCPTSLQTLQVFFTHILEKEISLVIALNQPDEIAPFPPYWDSLILKDQTFANGWKIEPESLMTTHLEQDTVGSDLETFEDENYDLRLPPHCLHSTRFATTPLEAQSKIVKRIFVAKRGDEVRNITHLHITRWADGTYIPDEKLLFLLLSFKDLVHVSVDKPIAIHCKAGLGRTGVVTLFDIVRSVILKQFRAGKPKEEISVDIFLLLFQLRQQRGRIVPTASHFAQVCEHTAHFINSLSDEEKTTAVIHEVTPPLCINTSSRLNHL